MSQRGEDNSDQSSEINWGALAAVAGVSVVAGGLLGFLLSSNEEDQRTPCAPVSTSSGRERTVSLINQPTSSNVTHGMNERPDTYDNCAICLKKQKPIKRLNCGHTFHYSCASTWLNINPTCPMCRKPQ